MHQPMWEFHWNVISLSVKAVKLYWGDSCFQYFMTLLNNMYFEWTLECIHYVSSSPFDSCRIKKYFITSKRLKNVYGIEQNIFKVKICFYQSMSDLLRQVTKHMREIFKWIKYFWNTPMCAYSAYADIYTLGKAVGILLKDIRVNLEIREQRVIWSTVLWAEVIICQQSCPLPR